MEEVLDMDEDSRDIIEDTDADTADIVDEVKGSDDEILARLDELKGSIDEMRVILARIETVQTDVIDTGVKIIEDEVIDEGIADDIIDDSALSVALETVDDITDILDSDKFDLSF